MLNGFRMNKMKKKLLIVLLEFKKKINKYF